LYLLFPLPGRIPQTCIFSYPLPLEVFLFKCHLISKAFSTILFKITTSYLPFVFP
jgi:hypothetical protein